uniref:Uncharacterized protein n=1 Tax=Lepeophtheirus salmonis TaxID=72036 RepID=A0A0K2V1N0_LEPSM
MVSGKLVFGKFVLVMFVLGLMALWKANNGKIQIVESWSRQKSPGGKFTFFYFILALVHSIAWIN